MLARAGVRASMIPILITAFLEGLSVLVVEIAGARALAPFFGTSLAVWTAMITSTLLFLATGYGLGGRMSEKRPDALPLVFWGAGGWLLLFPFWRSAVLGAFGGLGVSFGAFVSSAWLFGPPLTCMGAGFIIARRLFGHLPDQIGGAKVTLYAVLVEAVGLLMIWAAPGPEVAWLGAMLGGGGYAWAFQGLGVEAVRRARPQSRGAASGAYVAFQDVSMAATGPLGGLLAQAA